MPTPCPSCGAAIPDNELLCACGTAAVTRAEPAPHRPARVIHPAVILGGSALFGLANLLFARLTGHEVPLLALVVGGGVGLALKGNPRFEVRVPLAIASLTLAEIPGAAKAALELHALATGGAPLSLTPTLLGAFFGFLLLPVAIGTALALWLSRAEA